MDGIPLALELVASRVRFMDPEMILARYRGSLLSLSSTDPGIIDRHKSLSATFDWSYQLLTKEEKILLKRLSVFSGRFDLEAVEAVCTGGPVPKDYFIDLLFNLVDRSMVNTIRGNDEPMRYRLLEPVKEYAAGLLDPGETNQQKRRHYKFYTGLAEVAYKERFISQESWMNRLQLEHDNLMAALNWAERNSIQQYSRLAGFLAWYWSNSNKYFLARQRLGKLMETKGIKSENRARILAGYLWSLVGMIDKIEISYYFKISSKIISIWERLGNKKEEIIAKTDLAALYYVINNDDTAYKIAMETYHKAKAIGDDGVLLYCMRMVAQGQVNMRNFEEARNTIEVMGKKAAEFQNIAAKFVVHHNLGDCSLMEGKFEEAEREYGEGVRITMQFGYMHYLFTDLAGVAMAVAGMGRYVKALRIMAAVNKASEKAGIMSPELGSMLFWKEMIQLHIKATREKLGEDLTRKYESEGADMELEEVIVYALDFERD